MSSFQDIPEYAAFEDVDPLEPLEASVNESGDWEEPTYSLAARGTGRASRRLPHAWRGVKATPAAIERAFKMNVDLDRVPGTGKDGTVTVEDVRQFFYKEQGEPVPLPHYYPDGIVPGEAADGGPVQPVGDIGEPDTAAPAPSASASRKTDRAGRTFGSGADEGANAGTGDG